MLKTLIVVTYYEAVLMSTHNGCFGSKVRKKVYPCKPQFWYIKVGYEGVYFSWTCFPDGTIFIIFEIKYFLFVVIMSDLVHDV